jgi:fatty-acyl-CoA synthase
LTGRAKDLIIRGGHNIDPAMVEDALLAHPEVTGAAAVGWPDVHAGEVPVAYVTVAAGMTSTEEQLRRWAAERVAERAAAPKSVSIVDQLPMTAVGKLYKLPLRADAARRAVQEALSQFGGVHDVTATVDDGLIVVTVTLDPSADEAALRTVLDRYAITWEIKERS